MAEEELYEVEVQWRVILDTFKEDHNFWDHWPYLEDVWADADETFKRAIVVWWDRQRELSFDVVPPPPTHLSTAARDDLERLTRAERQRQRVARARAAVEVIGAEQSAPSRSSGADGLARGRATQHEGAAAKRAEVERYAAQGLSQRQVENKTGINISSVKRYWPRKTGSSGP